MLQTRMLGFLIMIGSVIDIYPQMFTSYYGGSDTESLTTMMKTPDGGYLMVGNTGSYGPATSLWFPYAYVVKTDPQGEITSSFAIGNDTLEFGDVGLSGVTEADGGGFLAVGTYREGHAYDGNVMLIKISPDGSFDWVKILEAPEPIGVAERGGRIKAVGNDEYIITGYRKWGAGTGDDNNCMIVKIDGAGNVLWTTEFGLASSTTSEWEVEEARDAVPLADGGYMIAGSKQWGESMQLAKIDSNGSFLWDRTYEALEGSSAFEIRNTPDGILLLAGHLGGIVLLKMDPIGDPIWQKFYTTDGALNGRVIEILPNGEILIGGSTSSPGSAGNGAVLRLDSNGGLMSATRFSLLNDHMSVISLAIENDEGLTLGFNNLIGEYDSIADFGLARISPMSLGFASICAYENFGVVVTDLPVLEYVSIMTQLPPFQLVTSELSWLPVEGGERNSLCMTVPIDEPTPDEVYYMISPNPATTGFKVDTKMEGALQIRITDSMGKEVLETTTVDRYVTLPMVASGLYYCHIRGQNGSMASVRLFVD